MPAEGNLTCHVAPRSLITKILFNALYVTIWIALSATVIMYNKWILAFSRFPFPIALTLWHMLFCSLLAFALVRSKVVPSADLSTETYMRAVVPIAALFAGTLWLGNAAYLYLSVSFIQMLKALMPVAVFIVGCSMGTEVFSLDTAGNMIVVSIGVAIASYGELNFVLMGVLLQLASVCTESTRLTLVQILLQSKGLRLNPVTTMYYIAPASCLFLVVPFALFEAPTIWVNPKLSINPFIFITNAGAAFLLNMSVFLLIGKTSALTMNIAGVIKDWMLIGLSVVLYASPVSGLNLAGYSLAFVGVCWFNYRKMQVMAGEQKQEPAAADELSQSSQSLLDDDHMQEKVQPSEGA